MTTRNNINAWELSLYIFAVLTVLSLMAIIVLFQLPEMEKHLCKFGACCDLLEKRICRAEKAG